MVEITKCPPGEAKGARDLQNWSQRRAVGKSGVWSKPKKPKSAKSKNRARAKRFRAGRKSYQPAVTPRTDWSDLNIYDMSTPPWEDQVVIGQHASIDDAKEAWANG